MATAGWSWVILRNASRPQVMMASSWRKVDTLADVIKSHAGNLDFGPKDGIGVTIRTEKHMLRPFNQI